MAKKTQSQIQRERTALAKGFREGGLIFCQCCPVRGKVPEQWTDMHEIRLRSQGGDPTDESIIRCICRDCHDWIHKNPVWARENGFMLARGDSMR